MLLQETQQDFIDQCGWLQRLIGKPFPAEPEFGHPPQIGVYQRRQPL
jgi:hypothetical protein